MTSGRVGAYPGSFDPPTIAHLAIAEAAVAAHDLARLDLVVSRQALDKEHVEIPRLEHRFDVLERVASTRPWLGVAITDHRLLADIAEGYDVLVVGADKYAQLHDVRYYGDEAAMHAALDRLPTLAVAPRRPHRAPENLVLDVDPGHHTVSSTLARAGAVDLMLPEAAAFDAETGAWTDPDRYRAWLATFD
jgi:phosphopantetheine adenylyltransferase